MQGSPGIVSKSSIASWLVPCCSRFRSAGEPGVNPVTTMPQIISVSFTRLGVYIIAVDVLVLHLHL